MTRSDPHPSTPAAAPRRRRARIALAAGALAALALGAAWIPRAGAGSIGPDVTVYEFEGIGHYGTLGGFRAFSLGTRSCNQGDVPLHWCDENILPGGGCGFGSTDMDHPVIAQNLYRLKEGRFEQIGMSWLKHGFLALQQPRPGCRNGNCEPHFNGDRLGVGCTDPYTSNLNGNRPLGMRSEVDAASGAFPFPYTEINPGDAVEQRIRVAVADLDPGLNPGARYWMEGQYVAPDDAAAGNGLNNASHQEVAVSPSLDLGFVGTIVREAPAIAAWKTADPQVELRAIDVPSSNPRQRFHVARRVTDLGGGNFHYEFAIHNLNSDRSAYRFTVDFLGPATITNAGFHDVDHHSGEPYDTTDWTADLSIPGQVTWSTDDHATDPNANALRWGTTFSFWFDATSGPGTADDPVHALGLFKPGTPAEVTFQVAEAVFSDGFASGDTSAWTSSTP
jgi:hypothetical protein